jgi:hypothetical protein
LSKSLTNAQLQTTLSTLNADAQILLKLTDSDDLAYVCGKPEEAKFWGGLVEVRQNGSHIELIFRSEGWTEAQTVLQLQNQLIQLKNAALVTAKITDDSHCGSDPGLLTDVEKYGHYYVYFSAFRNSMTDFKIFCGDALIQG